MSTTDDWMRALGEGYRIARRRHPERTLLLLFDIDGTILDMRSMMVHLLQEFDREHGTSCFRDVLPTDVNTHESDLGPLLAKLGVPLLDHARIIEWADRRRWSTDALQRSHQPLRGALDVIRWFQLQPLTRVGIVTGRDSSRRLETLACLNALGRHHRVTFDDELLFMRDAAAHETRAAAKVAGVEHFRAEGYQVFALVDNQPENLAAVASVDPAGEITLLHADTLFELHRGKPGERMVRGHDYDLTELLAPHDLPRTVDFAWHGVDDAERLRDFLASGVHWCEVDVRVHPEDGELVVRDEAFAADSGSWSERPLRLTHVLDACRTHGRGIKIDLREGGPALVRLLDALHAHELGDEDLWFNATVDRVGEAGLRRLAEHHPGAVVQCPVSFLTPLVLGAESTAREVLERMRSWGVGRFSLDWTAPQMREVATRLAAWGYDVNVYNVPDLEAFLQATLLTPRSVTSDFDFPKWDLRARRSLPRPTRAHRLTPPPPAPSV